MVMRGAVSPTANRTSACMRFSRATSCRRYGSMPGPPLFRSLMTTRGRSHLVTIGAPVAPASRAGTTMVVK